MSWRRSESNRNPPNYCNGRMPNLRSYPGSLDEYAVEKERAIAFQAADSSATTDMQIGHRYNYTQVNVYISGKKSEMPDAEELYQDILRKRKKAGKDEKI